LIVTSGPGALFHVPLLDSLSNGDSVEANQVLADGTVVSGDGLELFVTEDGKSQLYVSQNGFDAVSVFDLSNTMGTVIATSIGKVESVLFDAPATVAVNAESVWTANARFGTVPGLPAEGELMSNFTETFSVAKTPNIFAGESTNTTEMEEPTSGGLVHSMFLASFLAFACAW